MRANVSSLVLEGFAELVQQLGHSPSDIATRVGIAPEALYRSDLIIDEVRVNDLFEEAAKVCGERFFGLKLAQFKGLDILGPLWLLVRTASTVGESLTLLAENMGLHSQGVTANMVRDGHAGVAVHIEVQLPAAVSSHSDDGRSITHSSHSITQMVELALALTCKELRSYLGSHWCPRFAQFRYAAPEDLSPLRQVFGDHLFFNQDVTAIHLTDAECLQPTTPLNKGAQRVIKRQLESQVGQASSFVQRVTRIITLLINEQGSSAGVVAEALGIPVRTLQYRLKRQGASYQKLYDTARLELAKHYLLKSDLSVGAISERLHFMDTAALSHFFKRHVGCSPKSYVARLQGVE